jgi:hypothetical protein
LAGASILYGMRAKRSGVSDPAHVVLKKDFMAFAGY